MVIVTFTFCFTFNEKTNEKLETIASCLNIMKEFMIAESKYVRWIQIDTDNAIRKQL